MFRTMGKKDARTRRGARNRYGRTAFTPAGTARKALAVLLACAVAFALPGCKDTDVLTQKIIGAVGQYEIDYSVAPVSLDDPNATTTVSNVYEQQSESQEDYDEDTPQYDDQSTVDDQVDQEIQSNTYTDDTASTGAEEDQGSGGSGKAGAGEATGEEGEGNGRVISIADTDGDGVDDDDDDVVDPTQGEGSVEEGTTDDNNPAGTSQGTIITTGDGYGQLTPSSGVAAANYLGLIVQALCGEGGLKFTNSGWVDDLPAQAFSNKSEFAQTTVSADWGDGTVMTDTVLQQIIDSGADTYLYSLNCGYIGATAQQTLSNAGINVVQLNAMNVTDVVDSDIAQNVQVIGALLKDSGCQVNGMNPQQMASKWQQMHDTAIEGTVNANGGYAVSISEGTSLACIYQGMSNTPVTAERTRARTMYIEGFDMYRDGCYLNGTMNSSILRRSSSSWPGIYMWPRGDFTSLHTVNFTIDQSCGEPDVGNARTNVGTTSTQYTIKSYYLQCAGVAMVSPYISGFGWASDGTSRVSSTSSIQSGDSSKLVYPGVYDYPAVIASNANVAETIQRSASIANRSTMTVGLFNTGSPYRIYVMPEGVAGSWADGTFESFLLAPWALYVYDGGGANQSIDMTNVNNCVNEFYQMFYRTGAGGILDAEQFSDGTACWGNYLMATCPRD